MANTYYPTGTTRVNGVAQSGQKVTGSVEFATVSTSVDIRPGAAASQAALDKLCEVMSMRGQPVIVGGVTGSSAPFGLKVMFEHAGTWSALSSPNDLSSVLAASQASGQGFTTGNTTITWSSTL